MNKPLITSLIIFTAFFTHLSAQFAPLEVLIPPVFNQDIVVADFNNDNYPDVVATPLNTYQPNGTKEIFLYLGDGQGNFYSREVLASNFENTDPGAAFQAYDLDGDNDQDLLFFSSRSGIIWWENLETHFDSVKTLLSGTVHINIQEYYEFADMDKDGDLDVVLADDPTQGAIRYYQFTEEKQYSLAQTMVPGDSLLSTAFTVLDVDGDNDLDLAYANARNQVVFMTQEAGVFVENRRLEYTTDAFYYNQFYSEDMDSDGDQDLVLLTVRSVVWLENKSEDPFSQHHIVVDRSNSSGRMDHLKFTDLNQDDQLDLITGSFRDFINILVNERSDSLFQNNGRVFFELPVSASYLEDLDQDGYPDMIFAQRQRDRIEWLPNLAGSFQGPEIIEAGIGGGVANYRLEDINQDGFPDLLYDLFSNESFYYLNVGEGKFFERPVSIKNPFSAVPISHLIDKDGDGDLDLIYSNNGSQRLNTVYEFNEEENRFLLSDTLDYTGPIYPNSIVADIPENGGEHLLFMGGLPTTSRGISWLFNNQNQGTFSGPIIIEDVSGLANSPLRYADVDGDELKDIIALNTSGQVVYYQKDVNFSRLFLPGEPLFADLSAPAEYIQLADLDGDQKNDLIVIEAGKSYWLPNESGRFIQKKSLQAFLDTEVNFVLPGDMDSDGDQDLIVGEFPRFVGGEGGLLYYENPGDGNFDTPIKLDIQFTEEACLRDLDKDGDLDVVLDIGQAWIANQIPQKGVTTSTQVQTFNELNVFPNPTSQIFTVQLKESADDFSLLLYNSVGERVGIFQATQRNSFVIDLSNLPAGIYHFSLFNQLNGQNEGNGKIVKSHQK